MREVKTNSGKKAVQVVSKRDGKLKVHKHIGSYGTEFEKKLLYEKANEYIQEVTGQTSLLDLLNSVRTSELKITGNWSFFTYELLSRIYDKIGFNEYKNEVIKDLVLARVYQPASKVETRELLAEDFDRHYGINTLYRHLKKSIESGLKDHFQNALVQFCKRELQDSLKLVFYDVTTLYFESKLSSGVRDFGFSKDHRAQETQIVLGLVVNHQGLPLYFDVFKGNTFEGHTFIPVIEKIPELLNNPHLVVVADSAMISEENMSLLEEKGVGFIVGARVSNLPAELITKISDMLSSENGKVYETDYKSRRLVCDYSSKRASKDRSDRKKQKSWKGLKAM